MFINFLDCNFLILRLQLLLIERVKIEVALMLLRVTVLRAEHIFATTLHSQQPNLLFACPTLSLIILTKSYDQKFPSLTCTGLYGAYGSSGACFYSSVFLLSSFIFVSATVVLA